MCVGRSRQDPTEVIKENNETMQGEEDDQRDFSHIFREFETQLGQMRALMIQRLVHDPFYELMNFNPLTRAWMIRNLLILAEYAKRRYKVDLLQFFELIGRDDTLFYLRYKNAPVEIIVMWERMHPRSPPAPPPAEPSDSASNGQV